MNLVSRILILTAILVASISATSFADSPIVCSATMSSTGSCYASEWTGSLEIIFPRSNLDFQKYSNFISGYSWAERIDFMLQTNRRISRVLDDWILKTPNRNLLTRSSNRLNREIRSEVKNIISMRGLDMSQGLDTYKSYNNLVLQKRPLSCEIAATAGILSTLLEKPVSEDDLEPILSRSFYGVGKDDLGFWGDPERGFVGDIYGSQRKLTGYWVYEAPIGKIYQKYSVSTKLPTASLPQARLTEVLGALKDWKYVQLWGDWCTTPSADDGIASEVTTFEAISLWLNAKNTCASLDKDRTITWNSVGPNLEKIPVSALNGEHAFILLGYVGMIDSPTQIIVWDVNTGKHTYPTTEWMRKWSKMQNRAIIISKTPTL